MGYQTDLFGEFRTSRPLTVKEKKTLEDFAEERHGGNVDHDKDKPGFWCQWVPNEDGTAIQWDYNEKFYNYIEWIQYLVKHFFEPWGVKLNGEVEWEGEESGDLGKIIVTDNVVEVKEGRVVYE